MAGLLGFGACQKSKEVVAPAMAKTASQADAQADDQYKKDKSGQYVAKGVQVTGYKNGCERPTRPKYDILPDGMSTNSEPPIEPCGYPPYDPCPGSGGTTSSSIFDTSVGLGAFSGNSAGYIYALRK